MSWMKKKGSTFDIPENLVVKHEREGWVRCPRPGAEPPPKTPTPPPTTPSREGDVAALASLGVPALQRLCRDNDLSYHGNAGAEKLAETLVDAGVRATPTRGRG